MKILQVKVGACVYYVPVAEIRHVVTPEPNFPLWTIITSTMKLVVTEDEIKPVLKAWYDFYGCPYEEPILAEERKDKNVDH